MPAASHGRCEWPRHPGTKTPFTVDQWFIRQSELKFVQNAGVNDYGVPNRTAAGSAARIWCSSSRQAPGAACVQFNKPRIDRTLLAESRCEAAAAVLISCSSRPLQWLSSDMKLRKVNSLRPPRSFQAWWRIWRLDISTGHAPLLCSSWMLHTLD